MLTENDEPRGQSDPLVTPALVREVAEKVYALWLRDLRIERERLGVHRNQHNHGPRRQ